MAKQQVVVIEIPEPILKTLQEAGYTEKSDVEKIFTHFLYSLMNDDYSQFITDFNYWLDDEYALDGLILTEHYPQQIEYISDVDFVPEDREVYEKWPEPFRTQALEALDYRKENWSQMCGDRKAQFE